MAMSTENSDEIEALLPWHAAGTLSRDEAARVEAALAKDPELARRYALVREEHEEAIALNESLGTPPARAMHALLARIDAEPARHPPLHRRVASFIAGLSPSTLAWSATAAALVIAVQAGVIGTGLLTRPATTSYQTASAPAPVLAGGAYVLVRFSPQASAADITALLQANQASIVDGPRAGRFYKLRVGNAGLSAPELAKIVKRLQDDKAVSVVLPSR